MAQLDIIPPIGRANTTDGWTVQQPQPADVPSLIVGLRPYRVGWCRATITCSRPLAIVPFPTTSSGGRCTNEKTCANYQNNPSLLGTRHPMSNRGDWFGMSPIASDVPCSPLDNDEGQMPMAGGFQARGDAAPARSVGENPSSTRPRTFWPRCHFRSVAGFDHWLQHSSN